MKKFLFATKKVRLAKIFFPMIILLVFFAALVNAANPIITNRFTADPSAHVFEGKVYLYITDDQGNSGTYWDSRDWRAFSSSDLINWTDHGAIFSISNFSWATQYAWAPNAIYRNGNYYLYLPVDRTKIGVAVSASPAGPFTDAIGGPLVDKARDANAGDEPIDPCVFVDDDGQAYLYFGTRVPKVVKLTSDMIHLNGAITNLQVTGSTVYAEAPWLHKYNGVYYFSYSTGWPGQIHYATGTSPMGPFTYQGVILDYIPNLSTNHQATVQYNGEWYIFYHNGALPGGGGYKRSVCIDRMYYNGDGTIPQVIQTKQGVEGGPNYKIINRKSGKTADVSSASTADGADVIQWTYKSSANQVWKLIDVGSGYYRIENANSGKVMEVLGGSTADGADVVQWTYTGAASQQWQLVDVGSGYYKIVNCNSGKVLDVSGGSTVDGGDIIQWPYTGGSNQQWQVVSLVPSTSTATPTPTSTPTPTMGPTPTPGSGPVVWYKFNESSGTTAADSSGNGKNATLVNGPTWVAGKSGNAVNLDGTNDYVSMPTGIISGLNDFSIAAWVKLDMISTWSRIFDFGTGTTVNMFLTPKGGSNVIRYAITTSGNSVEQQINGTAALTTGTWQHVAVTLSGSLGILYVNGAEVSRNSSMTLKPSSLGSTNLNYIGKSQYSDPYLDGQVDSFRIYNRALSVAEVSSLYTGGN